MKLRVRELLLLISARALPVSFQRVLPGGDRNNRRETDRVCVCVCVCVCVRENKLHFHAPTETNESLYRTFQIFISKNCHNKSTLRFWKLVYQTLPPHFAYVYYVHIHAVTRMRQPSFYLNIAAACNSVN